jgi:hypothetical protein
MRAAITGLFLLLPLILAGSPSVHAQTFFDEDRPAAEARVPGFLGPTGLLQTPSAYVLRNREASAHFGGDADFAAGGVAAGIGGRLEAGVTLREGGGGAWVNAKANVLPETLLRPALSVGIVDAFDASRASGYVVASKYVIPYFVEALTGRTGFAIKLHIGYGGGIYGHDVFAGTELILDNGLSGIAELSGGRANLGVRWLRQNLSATVGLFDFDRIGGIVSFRGTLP